MGTKSKLYTINQISLRYDIPKSTLRFWEKRFENFLTPIRTHGGQRRYSDCHIEVIQKIRDLKNRGLSLDEISENLDSHRRDPGIGCNVDMIDQIAEKISEIVKMEIYRFFKVKENL